MGVEISSEMDGEAKIDAVNRAAFELQAFFDTHHNQADNMPGTKRDRESSDDMSAEAARCDAMRKVSKTCAETEYRASRAHRF